MFVRSRTRSRRKGAALVEFAVVCPVFILVLMGAVVVGLGGFRREEVEHLARESARWAAVRDPSLWTWEQIRANVLRPKAVGVDPETITGSVDPLDDGVAVTLSYQWIPEVFFAPRTITFTAPCRVPY